MDAAAQSTVRVARVMMPEKGQYSIRCAEGFAAKRGVRVVVNPAPYEPWVSKYLADAWLITPNRAEACQLLGCAEEALEGAVAASPYPRMAVTLGGEGALVKDGELLARIPATLVTPVDTTGAGDCVNGVLCAKLLEGCALADAARTAVRAASISVTRAHVLDAMPREEEVRETE